MYHAHTEIREVYFYLDAGPMHLGPSPQPTTRFLWFKDVTTVAATHPIKTDHNNNHNHNNTSLYHTDTEENCACILTGNTPAYGEEALGGATPSASFSFKAVTPRSHTPKLRR